MNTTMESRRWQRGLPIRAGLALVAAASIAGCGNAEADGAEDPANDDFVRIINVETVLLEPTSFVDEIRLTGAATANRDVQVAAEESGTIREVWVEKGSRVAAGQAIAKIDDAILRAQADQARAQAELAAQTWDRRKRLWEEDRVGSEIAYLQAKFAAEQTAANLRALEERLEHATIRAPFAGVLDERAVELGTMVSPGQYVGRVVDLDPIKIVAGVPERYAADVQVAAEGRISFDVIPDEVFVAPVHYVSSTVDAKNRTFGIEIEIPNPQGLIKPEMVANVQIAKATIQDAIVVPQDALVRVEQGYVTFVVVEKDGVQVAEVRPVVLGASQRNQVVVKSGVAAGDRLIVIGQKSVADGDRVKVVGDSAGGSAAGGSE